MTAKVYRGSWIVTVPLAAAAVAYLVAVFLPGRRAIATLQEEVTKKQEYVAQAAGLAKGLAATQQELEKTLAYTANWKKHAPAEGERAALYGKIHELAKAAGTLTTRFDPKPVNSRMRIRDYPLTMGCTGTFAQVHELLRSLETLPVEIWVDTVLIKKGSETGDSVACEANLVVFTDNPESSD